MKKPMNDIVDLHEKHGDKGMEQLANKSRDVPAEEHFRPPETVDIDPIVYSPVFGEPPPQSEPIICMNGSVLLCEGGLFCIAALPGSAKSHLVTEGIVARALNPEAERLLFDVARPPGRGVVYIDTERPDAQVYASFMKCMHRAGITRKADVPDWLRFLVLPVDYSNEDRRRATLEAIQSVNAGLVVVDGIGDYVTDPNDAIESNRTIDWFRLQMKRLRFGTVTTIHTNPGMGREKPRGHLGSEVMRRGDCVGFITSDKTTGQRTLTTKSENGKVRSGGDVEGWFIWDDAAATFVECENGTHVMNPDTFIRLRDLAILAYEPNIFLSATELIQRIASTTNTTKNNAKKKLGQLKRAGLIVQSEPRQPWYLNVGDDGTKGSVTQG